jgi:transposase
MEQISQPLVNAAAEPEFAAFIAIDWADRKHYWSLQVAGQEGLQRGTLDHTPEAVEVWIMELHVRFGGRPLAVALEQRRGALAVMLSQYAHVHLYPVHPMTLAKFREAWYPSGSKSDPSDADLLLEILTAHRSRLRRLDPDTVEMRLLQHLVEHRRKLVDERTALSNRLTDLLKLYFPQILGWFNDVASAVVGDLLEQWPSLQALQQVKPAKLEKFLREHHCAEIAERLTQIRQAIPATHDRALLDSAPYLVTAWVRQMAVLREAIRQLEKHIAEQAAQQEDWHIFQSLPGAGAVLAPRLMVALGTQRDRYASASDLQSFSGIAPVKEASGNTQWVHFRWACPKFLRQTFHEWAACSMAQCEWAKAYYQQQKARGKKHHVAVRALAFKWMRILYRCWKDRQPYREEIYLASLAKRRTAMVAALAKAVQMP